MLRDGIKILLMKDQPNALRKSAIFFILEKVPESDITLSMGMSTDYLRAIEQGANVVRVGSKIFGARDYAK